MVKLVCVTACTAKEQVSDHCGMDSKGSTDQPTLKMWVLQLAILEDICKTALSKKVLEVVDTVGAPTKSEEIK